MSTVFCKIFALFRIIFSTITAQLRLTLDFLRLLRDELYYNKHRHKFITPKRFAILILFIKYYTIVLIIFIVRAHAHKEEI